MDSVSWSEEIGQRRVARLRWINVGAHPACQPRAMTAEDKDYFLERAEAELDLAQVSTNAAAVRAHYVLASYYLDRVYGGEDCAACTDLPR
jgi:hypothetical protein